MTDNEIIKAMQCVIGNICGVACCYRRQRSYVSHNEQRFNTSERTDVLVDQSL